MSTQSDGVSSPSFDVHVIPAWEASLTPHPPVVLQVRYDTRFPDRIVVHDPTNPSEAMTMDFPQIGKVGLQIDRPLLLRLIEVFADEFDLARYPDSVMAVAWHLAEMIRKAVDNGSLRMEPYIGCNATARSTVLDTRLFYRARMLLAQDGLPPQLLLEQREPDEGERA